MKSFSVCLQLKTHARNASIYPLLAGLNCLNPFTTRFLYRELSWKRPKREKRGWSWGNVELWMRNRKMDKTAKLSIALHRSRCREENITIWRREGKIEETIESLWIDQLDTSIFTIVNKSPNASLTPQTHSQKLPLQHHSFDKIKPPIAFLIFVKRHLIQYGKKKLQKLSVIPRKVSWKLNIH